MPRHRFVPPSMVPQAYNDHPLPIGNRQTISQPYIVAFMSELLDVEKGHKVLEIGTGCGYQAAVLSVLAGEVYSIEIVEELGVQARERLRTLGYDNVEVKIGNGYAGWPEQAPFDRIILTAAPNELPRTLIDQLKNGGKLVAPVGDSPYRFDRVGWWSPLLFLTMGYAVLDNPTMPIIGEGDVEPNDSYIEQLVASARAAVDEAARRGAGDPERAAIGGHSYGAFMTANLLAHSDIFRAGIARSGAYNRSLTPFGFQAEERTLWQATDVYFQMSPFMHAEKVDEPILLIHGEADNNSGTYPMQSERYYNALKGLGATARLVMLPHESHGYRARESVMHMLWESNEWLERYTKNAGPRGETAAGEERAASSD